MQCPYCRFSLRANAIECPACRLSYPRTCALLGAVPRLSPVVADTTRSLASADHDLLKRRIAAIEKRFPELSLQVVIHHFPKEHPFSMHAFWLFNAAALDGVGKRGGDNHALLLTIDPARGESALMPGYGLEPFLSDEGLGHLLDLAGPAWAEGRWTDGIMRVLDGLDQWLETIAIPKVGQVQSKGEF